MEEKQREVCAFCGEKLAGPYCAQCGKPKIWKKMDGTYFLQELAGVFNLDKGLLFTLKSLLFSPGKALRDYLHGDRSKYIKPLTFLLATSFFYTIISRILKVTPAYTQSVPNGENPAAPVIEWISSHFGYANLMLGLVMGILIRLFFRKHAYHYVEILAILCFSMGMQMMVLLGFEGILFLFPGIHYSVGALLMVGYGIWSIGSFFNPPKFSHYIKITLVHLLSFVLFNLAILVLAFILNKVG
jgi:hypothetical protein